jgi:hypothetical protein
VSAGATRNYVTVWAVERNYDLRAVRVDVDPWNRPENVRQHGTNTRLWVDNVGDRFLNVVYRNGFLWTVHHVGNSTGRFCRARYLRLDVSNFPTSVTNVEDVSYGANGFWYFYPAITADADNNMVMVFNRSSTTEYAGIRYACRRDGEDMSWSVLLKAGEGTHEDGVHSPLSYGDYNGIAIDPVNDSVWMFSQYPLATMPRPANWHAACGWNDTIAHATWFGQVSFLGSPPEPTLAEIWDRAYPGHPLPAVHNDSGLYTRTSGTSVFVNVLARHAVVDRFDLRIYALGHALLQDDVQAGDQFSFTNLGFIDTTKPFGLRVDTTFTGGTVNLAHSESRWNAGEFLGPLHVVLDTALPAGVTVNSDGTTTDGKPFWDYTALAGDGKLSIGEVSLAKLIEFTNPRRTRFRTNLRAWAASGSGKDRFRFYRAPACLPTEWFVAFEAGGAVEDDWNDLVMIFDTLHVPTDAAMVDVTGGSLLQRTTGTYYNRRTGKQSFKLAWKNARLK